MTTVLTKFHITELNVTAGPMCYTYAQIQTYDDVYTWVNKNLMPNLYSSDWYNGEPLRTWRDVLQTKDRATIRLGIARLRQMRIKDGQFDLV